jgi:hypothetical protein
MISTGSAISPYLQPKPIRLEAQMAIAIPVWPFRHLKDHKAVYNEEEESSAVQAAKELPIGVKSLSRPLR